MKHMDENSTRKPDEAVGEKTAAPETSPKSAEAEQAPPEIPLPPATLEFLVLSLRSQAEMQLSLLHFGEEKDRPKPNLPLARHTIDLIAMLAEKTKGNLTMEESRLVENSLTELRFRYVQAMESASKQ